MIRLALLDALDWSCDRDGLTDEEQRRMRMLAINAPRTDWLASQLVAQVWHERAVAGGSA